jgi:hypothetical protein
MKKIPEIPPKKERKNELAIAVPAILSFKKVSSKICKPSKLFTIWSVLPPVSLEKSKLYESQSDLLRMARVAVKKNGEAPPEGSPFFFTGRTRMSRVFAPAMSRN